MQMFWTVQGYFLNSKHFYYHSLWDPFTFNWYIFLVLGHSGDINKAERQILFCRYRNGRKHSSSLYLWQKCIAQLETLEGAISEGLEGWIKSTLFPLSTAIDYKNLKRAYLWKETNTSPFPPGHDLQGFFFFFFSLEPALTTFPK